ncbi:DUF2750 domain-containing protein [Sphingobacterium sp. LRF_L2]|uniref:DUF2750 domain-containing protein n=1 Tax=Sphingobacterium sp. LRF_L2 TaxID=3369421 RepID=UPI003F619E7E
MHTKEIEAVSSLQPFERYKYFIKKIADSELVYTLVDVNNRYIISTIDNQELFPMWSSKEFAYLCKISGWESLLIKELNFDDLENEIFDMIASSNYLINVFPVYDRTGFVVNLDEFADDLKEELENYS